MTEHEHDAGTRADIAATGDRADPGDPGATPEVEELVVAIAETRAEMTGTVEELGDRLDPAVLATQAGDRVREATIGKVESKVEDMTQAASDIMTNAADTAQGAGAGVMETIRANPIPAALAGFGIGWLVLNRRSAPGYRMSNTRSSTWRAYDDRYAQPSAGLPSAIAEGARSASSAVGDAAASARDTAASTMASVGETADQAASTVGSSVGQAAWQAQRAFESNPLAFGAVAVAVGAAIGLALPATEAEKRVMSEPGGRLIDKVEETVSQPLERMETASAR